jgi:hypothetical protein
MGASPEIVRPGDVHRAICPVEREFELVNGSQEWQRVVSVQPDGWCDCCDVAFEWPTTFLGATYRVLLRTGTIHHLVAYGAFPVFGQLALGATRRSGILERIRGQYHDEVIVEVRTSAAIGGRGKVRAVSWARSGGSAGAAGDASELAAATDRVDGLLLRTNQVVHPWPCVLVGFHFRNDGAADRYLMWFDRPNAAPNGTIPAETPITIAAGGQGWYFPPATRYDVGLTWSSSSTPNALTVTLAADLWVTTYLRGL